MGELKMKKIKNFDEKWSDEIFDIEAIEMPLLFPTETPKNGKIWIKNKLLQMK